LPFVFEKNVGKSLISVEDLKYARTKVGSTKDRFQDSYIGHTCVGPQNLRRPRAPHFLNTSLLITPSEQFTIEKSDCATAVFELVQHYYHATETGNAANAASNCAAQP